MSDINIKITKDENDGNKSEELEFDIDLRETQAPILEEGQIGEVIIPVRVLKFGKEKARVKQEGRMRIDGDFRQKTASELKKSLPNAER